MKRSYRFGFTRSSSPPAGAINEIAGLQTALDNATNVRRTVESAVEADHTGWKVGDIIEQTGRPPQVVITGVPAYVANSDAYLEFFFDDYSYQFLVYYNDSVGLSAADYATEVASQLTAFGHGNFVAVGTTITGTLNFFPVSYDGSYADPAVTSIDYLPGVLAGEYVVADVAALTTPAGYLRPYARDIRTDLGGSAEAEIAAAQQSAASAQSAASSAQSAANAASTLANAADMRALALLMSEAAPLPLQSVTRASTAFDPWSKCTVASGEARTRSFPVVPGLDVTAYLAEAQRANILLRSQEFEDAVWTATDCTVTDATDVAPDTTVTAARVVATDADATLMQSVTLTANDHTASIYLRRVSGFGAVTLHLGASSVVCALTTEWKRYQLPLMAPAAGSVDVGITLATAGNEISVWGAQVEQWHWPSSYIATEGSPVTRARDDIRLDLTTDRYGPFNPTQGSYLWFCLPYGWDADTVATGQRMATGKGRGTYLVSPDLPNWRYQLGPEGQTGTVAHVFYGADGGVPFRYLVTSVPNHMFRLAFQAWQNGAEGLTTVGPNASGVTQAYSAGYSAGSGAASVRHLATPAYFRVGSSSDAATYGGWVGGLYWPRMLTNTERSLLTRVLHAATPIQL